MNKNFIMKDTSPRFAFFDVDDTLIRIKSMFNFYSFWAQTYCQNSELLEAFNADFQRMRAENFPRTELNRAYYRFMAGVAPDALCIAGEMWARKWLDQPENFFLFNSVKELFHLKELEVTPVFVSGSFEAVLNPIADYLGVTHILATQMIIGTDGKYTGEIGTPQTIGAGKAEAVRAFLYKTGGKSSQCIAIGDDLSDLPMLQSVSKQIVVGQNTDLAKHAQKMKWRTIASV